MTNRITINFMAHRHHPQFFLYTPPPKNSYSIHSVAFHSLLLLHKTCGPDNNPSGYIRCFGLVPPNVRAVVGSGRVESGRGNLRETTTPRSPEHYYSPTAKLRRRRSRHSSRHYNSHSSSSSSSRSSEYNARMVILNDE